MATKTYTQIVTHPANRHRERPWDLSVTFTRNQGDSKSNHHASSDFRRERTAPPSFEHSRSKTLPTRFSPYSRDIPPPVPKNIVYGVHTSLNLPPYKSPADEFLPQIKVCRVLPIQTRPHLIHSKDPKELEGAPPQTEVTKAQDALALAQAVRSTSHAHQVYLRTQIAEGEAVLMILRQKAEDAEARLQQADYQLGSLRSHLDSRGIPTSPVVDEYMTEYHAVESAYGTLDADESEEEREDKGEDDDAESNVAVSR